MLDLWSHRLARTERGGKGGRLGLDFEGDRVGTVGEDRAGGKELGWGKG